MNADSVYGLAECKCEAKAGIAIVSPNTMGPAGVCMLAPYT